MKSGIIGLISGESSKFESRHVVQEQDGYEFSRAIETDQPSSDAQNQVQEGRALIQTVEEEEVAEVDESGRIYTSEEGRKKSKYSEFLVVPGEFVVVEGGGEFVFDLLSSQLTSGTVQKASINLNGCLERIDGTPWQVGFYGKQGDTEKGVLYGDSIFTDEDLGEVAKNSKKNQLGMDHDFQGTSVRSTITESGYINIYQPSNMKSSEFAEYLSTFVIPEATTQS